MKKGVEEGREEEKEEKGKDNKGKKDSRRIRNLGWERRSSKIGRRGEEVGTRMFSSVDLCLWKETEWKDANKKTIKPCNWDQERICTKEEEDISIIKEEEIKDAWVHTKTIEKMVYQTLKIVSNSKK